MDFEFDLGFLDDHPDDTPPDFVPFGAAGDPLDDPGPSSMTPHINQAQVPQLFEHHFFGAGPRAALGSGAPAPAAHPLSHQWGDDGSTNPGAPAPASARAAHSSHLLGAHQLNQHPHPSSHSSSHPSHSLAPAAPSAPPGTAPTSAHSSHHTRTPGSHPHSSHLSASGSAPGHSQHYRPHHYLPAPPLRPFKRKPNFHIELPLAPAPAPAQAQGTPGMPLPHYTFDADDFGLLTPGMNPPLGVGYFEGVTPGVPGMRYDQNMFFSPQVELEAKDYFELYLYPEDKGWQLPGQFVANPGSVNQNLALDDYRDDEYFNLGLGANSGANPGTNPAANNASGAGASANTSVGANSTSGANAHAHSTHSTHGAHGAHAAHSAHAQHPLHGATVNSNNVTLLGAGIHGPLAVPPRAPGAQSPGPGRPRMLARTQLSPNVALDRHPAAKKKRNPKGAVCTVCDKYILRDLTRHMRIHNEVGRFQCVYPKQMCNHKTQNFNRPYDYKKHLLHMHFRFDDPKGKSANTLTDKLPLLGQCMACGAKFVAKDWLDHHVLTPDAQARCPYVELVRAMTQADYQAVRAPF